MELPNLKVLERTPALKGATPEWLAEFARQTRCRTFARREALWREGDSALYFCVLRRGLVKLVRHTGAGRRVICNLIGAPESVGDIAVLKGSCYPAGAVAATDVETVEFPRELLSAAMLQCPDLAESVWCNAQQRMQQLLHSIDALSAGGVEARLATVFLTLHERFGDDFDDGLAVLPVALTRQDLADLVSTTQETTIRILCAWERRNLVSSVECGFTVNDLQALRVIAGRVDPSASLPLAAE